MFDVVIPALKCNPVYLRLAIDSVLSQTCPDFEIYISDGSPLDHPHHSKNTLEDIDDPRLHILQQVGVGISDARNQALNAGTNPYVCTLDADDLWEERKLEYYKLRIQNTSEPIKMMWGAARSNYGGEHYRAGYFEEWEKTKSQHRWLRLYWSPLMTSTILYERKALEYFGGWNPFLTMGEDMEVNWKFMWYYPTQCIQCPCYLGTYRNHPESTMQDGDSGHKIYNTSVIPNTRRFNAQKMLESMKQASPHNPTPHWKYYWKWYEKVLHECRASSNGEMISGKRTHPLHILQRTDGYINGSKFVERPDFLTEEYLTRIQ